ncbi:NAD(P)-binding domain [Lasallia pustulata]|uniref:2,4-dienoyl-CoA reductase [(3E)-enoyl-CoA-producing] n=1 Tax=Lasallia pustulata TaxID=136370 RepID=A0A1W5D6U3_9LECA|nr:NAD(P)-binding domain [Lasallia pustulata]
MAAKAAVDALSAAAALELGPRGVTSNVIAPGPIAGTEGVLRLAKKEHIAGSEKRIPVGRWGTVRDIADATVWVFSEAAGFVNGAVLVRRG